MKCIYCDGDTKKHGKNKKGLVNYKCVNCNKFFTDGSNERLLAKKKERELLVEKVKKMYLDDGLSTTEIGKLIGKSSTIPQRIIKELGISRTISDSKKGKKIGRRVPIEQIIKLYQEGKSSVVISKELNISKRSVLNVLVDNDIERNNSYEYFHSKIDDIKKMYSEGKSMLHISKKLNVSYGAINMNLHKLGIVRTEDKNHIRMDYDTWLKQLSAFKKYRLLVNRLTYKIDVTNLLNYDKRGVSGTKGAYQLDHKFSVCEGFKQGVDPHIIANINNLEFIPWEENIKKLDKCSITLEELLKIIKNYE